MSHVRSEELLLTPSQRTLWVKTQAMPPKIIMLATLDFSNITRIHDKYVVSLGKLWVSVQGLTGGDCVLLPFWNARCYQY